MKILYGVVGEGMGHAVRSSVVLEHLVELGHEISIMASGRAVDFLSKRFQGVTRIHGLHMVYEDNRVQRARTLWSNVQMSARGVPHNIATYFELIRGFRPDLVVSDFESWTYLYGQAHRLPVISIDNMQIINRCKIPKQVIGEHKTLFKLTRAFVRGKLLGCDHYVITTFFRPPVRKKRTTLVPPILRPDILAATPSRGDHILVYQTAEGAETLLETLASSGLECRVYGVRRNLENEVVEGTMRYLPFSEERFVSDLASCRGVVAGGGFTLMGEAVYLKKPMLSVPLGGQFEQILNGRYLEHEGFGRMALKLDEPQAIQAFLADIPRFEDALSRYQQAGNRELIDVLDGLLDRAEAGLL
jgi:uncharacterized protein (TIGR00661 family)